MAWFFKIKQMLDVVTDFKRAFTRYVRDGDDVHFTAGVQINEWSIQHLELTNLYPGEERSNSKQKLKTYTTLIFNT